MLPPLHAEMVFVSNEKYSLLTSGPDAATGLNHMWYATGDAIDFELGRAQYYTKWDGVQFTQDQLKGISNAWNTNASLYSAFNNNCWNAASYVKSQFGLTGGSVVANGASSMTMFGF